MESKGTTPQQMRVVGNGRLEVKSSWETRGVTPEMLQWYEVYRDNTEKYRQYHRNHIDLKVLRRAADGTPIKVVERQRLGNRVYNWRPIRGSDNAEGHRIEIAIEPLKFPTFTIRSHTVLEQTPTGTMRHSTHTYGSTIPVIGTVYNLFLRTFVLPDFLKNFAPHRYEEARNLEAFLPKIYAEAQKT